MIALQEIPQSLDAFTVSRLEGIRFLPFLQVMVISLLCGFFVSFLYSFAFRDRATGSDVNRVFPLLAIAITAIFIAIQNSVWLALGLLGSLSIVRFRTPIKEAEEVGFILLVIASSICCATFYLRFLGGLLLVAVAAVVIRDVSMRRPLIRAGRRGMLIVTLREPAADALHELTTALSALLPGGAIDSVERGEQETVVSYAFHRSSDEAILGLEKGLAAVDGELTYHLFLNRPGEA